jgi:hypothetical protein
MVALNPWDKFMAGTEYERKTISACICFNILIKHNRPNNRNNERSSLIY